MKHQAQENAVLVMQGSCIIYPPRIFAFDENFVDIIGKNRLTMFWAGDSKRNFAGMKQHQASAGIVAVNWCALQRNATSKEIVSQLGGLKKVIFTLAEVYSLLADQADKPANDLLCRQNGNMIYVLNSRGVAMALSIWWWVDSQAWGINAVELESPHRWEAGRRVFSLHDA